MIKVSFDKMFLMYTKKNIDADGDVRLNSNKDLS